MKRSLLSLFVVIFTLANAPIYRGGYAFAGSSGSCGDNATYTLSDAGVLTISGTGPMTFFSNASDAPWYSSRASITSVVVQEGITKIGSRAFCSCTAATSIDLPSTLDSIGYYSFYDFGSSSAVINFNGTLEQWCNVGIYNNYTSCPFYRGDKKFRLSGSEIKTVNIPASVTKIKPFTFYGITNITKVTIPNTVTVIGRSAFYSCSGLTTLTFTPTSSVDSIALYAFYGTKMTTLTIPSSVRVIGDNAFQSCSALTTINFDNATSLKVIGEYAFQGSTGLTSLSLRGATSLTTIKQYAFARASSNSTSLGYLYLPASVRTIETYAFSNRAGIEGIVIMNSSTSDANLTKCASTYTFNNVTKSIPVYVYSASVQSAYSGLTAWSQFTNYKTNNNITFNCGTPTASNLVATLNVRTGELTFSGSGAMKDFDNSSNKAPWRDYPSILQKVTISKMSRVGAYAFYSCSNIRGSVSIPSTVVTIGDRAFYGCSGLTDISFASATALTTIDTYAFYNCSTFVALDLTKANALTTISDRAFYGCSKINGTVVFPASMTTIGTYAFSGCTSVDEIIIRKTSGTITASSSYSFNNMVNTIPVRVKTAALATTYRSATGWSHFKNFTTDDITGQCGDNLYWSLNPFTGALSITGTGTMWNFNTTDNKAPWYELKNLIASVTIAKTVESIGDYAFKDCSSVTSFTFNYDEETGHNSLVSIGQYAFQNCSSATFSNLWSTRSANLTTVGTYACHNCSTITSVTIPENVTFMDDMVFTGTNLSSVQWNATNYTSINLSTGISPFYSRRSNITSFSFGSNVTYIPQYLCYNMTALTGTLTIPNTITGMGRGAFYKCTGLTCLTFEASCQLTEIPAQSFRECTNLTLNSTTFPTTVTSVRDSAFYQCTSIANVSFSSTNRVTTIGNYAFYGCTGMTTLSLGSTSRVTSIGSHAFDGCNAITTSSISLPPGLTTLGTYAFNGCSGLRGTLTISCPSLTSIPNNAFAGCTALTGLDLTKATSLATIGNDAFSGCSSIAGEIYIPSTVTSIGTKAFYGCSAVTSMYVEPTSIPTATTSATTGTFQGMTSTIPVRVPASMVSGYQEAPGWEYFSAIQAYAAGQCGDNLYWRVNYNKSKLEITGTGAMWDYNGTDNLAPWKSHTSYWTSISFPAEMTTFGQYSFYECTNLSGSISFLAGLEQIKNRAFSGCTGITGLTFTSATSLTTIGAYAFYGCNHSSFTTLTLPNSLTTINSSAFGMCTRLTTVTIPENVRTMSCSSTDNTFYACSNITTVNWNAIACSDFSNSGGQGGVSYHTPWGLSKSVITTFNIGSKVRIIPKYLCQGLTNITSISLGDSLREIHEGAFIGCTRLTTVTLPGNLTSLGNSAFKGCSGMIKVDMSAANKLTTIGLSTFEGCSNVDGLVYVPASVTEIGTNAFKDFSKVDTLVASRNLPPTAASSTFTNMVKSIPLIVPDADAVTAYGGAPGWEEFTNIKTHSFSGQCGDNVYWSLNLGSGELSLTGTGAMWDYWYTTTPTQTTSPWYGLKNFVKRVTVADGITYLGNYAFRDCKAMQSISLPASITSMATSVFSVNPQMKDYSYAGTLENWLAIDFVGSGGNPISVTRGKPNIEGEYITKLEIPEGYTTIKKYQFIGCQGLTKLYLPSTLTSLGTYAFHSCTGLTDIYSYALTPPTLPINNGNIFGTDLIKTTILHTMCVESEDLYKADDTYSDHWGKFSNYEVMNDYCSEIIVDDDAVLSDILTTEFTVNLQVESGQTLTMDDIDGTVNIKDITLEPGARMELEAGAEYSIKNLIMQREGGSATDNVATAQIKGSLTAENLILDFTLDDSRWFPISLPQTITANSVKVNGVAQTPDVDYYALSFNGAKRAENGFSATGDNWEWVTEGNLNANQGYLIGLPEGSKTLRFTMPGYTFAETSDKNVAVTKHESVWGETNEGWNLIGNPYLQAYKNSEETMAAGAETLSAVTLLSATGEDLTYTQTAVDEAVLPPFSAVLVQTPATGSLVFDNTSAGKALAPARYPKAKQREFIQLTLSGNGGMDKTELIIGDYDENYKIGADLVKWHNDAYTSQTAPTLYTFKGENKQAFNARSEEMLKNIPVGYHATKAGNYTFSLGKDAAAFEHIWLYDSEKNITTDLKMSDYTFTTDAGTIDTRFRITASLIDHQEVPTDVEKVNSEERIVNSKKIIRDGLFYIERDGKIYTVTGQKVL